MVCLSVEEPRRAHVLGLKLGKKDDILEPLPADFDSFPILTKKTHFQHKPSLQMNIH